MKVLIISASTERINVPTLPLGPAMVAAAVRKAGHPTEFLDLKRADDPLAAVSRAISEVEPELIGVSVRNIDDQNMAQPDFLLERLRPIVAACKAASTAPIVLGGAGYSIFPVAALDFLEAHMGIRGEGELVFTNLVSTLQDNGIPNFLPGIHLPGLGPNHRRQLPLNLDTLDYPFAELLASAELRDPEVWIPIQTRRGCPLDCTYCSTPAIEGRTPRMRSPKLVAADVARLVEAGVRRLHFVDNTFNLPERYALELCHLLTDLGTPLEWRCIVYPYKVSEQLVEAMAAAGCREVALGAESGSDRMLQAFNKRFDAAEVHRVSGMLKTAGIKRIGFLLLGGPGETRESVIESLDFAEFLSLDMLKITVGVRIYPETPLAITAVADGQVAADDDLLRPRFYLTPGLEDLISEAIESRRATLPIVG